MLVSIQLKTTLPKRSYLQLGPWP